MKYSSVVGAGFGDEGKGSFVNHLCSQSQNPLIIRFNGGHQAGHTVLHEGIRHTFSSFGSGTLQGIPTYWSKFCTFFPTAIYNEYKQLQKIGINPIIYIDPLCPVTTPYDVLANHKEERLNNHGSVGVGFGTTIKRHESYYKLYFQDIFNRTVLEAKMSCIKQYYREVNNDYESVIEDKLNAWYKCIDELILEDVISKSKMGFKDLRYDYEGTKSGDMFYKDKFDHIIFEGAQGILLDMDFGFFPNVTRSNTTNKNVIQLISELNLPKINKMDIYYMTRCYQTRHGVGYMSNRETIVTISPEHKRHIIVEKDLINIENEINIDGGHQGIFRKSFLDLDLLKYAIDCDNNFTNDRPGMLLYPIFFNKHIVVTCLDQIQDPFNIKYTINKELFTTNITEMIKNIKKYCGVNKIIYGESEGKFIRQNKEADVKYKSVINFKQIAKF